MTEEKKDTNEDSRFHFPHKDKYENMKKLIYSAVNQLEKIQNVIESMEQDERKVYYQSIPGTEGNFDGQYLIAQDGRKTEVPENYAAKSRLVYGDVLKVFNDAGKQVFKQIDRVERKKVSGVLTKKEGKWYLLSDSGSYRVSDASAEFNGAMLNDKASAYVPAKELNAPWAALDEVFGEDGNRKRSPHFEVNKDVKKEIKVEKKDLEDKKIKDFPRIEKKKEEKREEKSPRPKPRYQKPQRKNFSPKKEEKTTKVENKSPKEYVNNILDDDDLR